MKATQRIIKPLLGAVLVMALLLVPLSALAQGQVEEQVGLNLDAVGGSGVSGSALIKPAGDGTNVTLEVQGLPSGATARAVMNAGTCAQPSASFATLPNLQADSNGKATATGAILFHGTEPVSLATVADGQHIISIATDKVVACGVIPHLAAVSGPSQLPATGGTGQALLGLAVAAALGLGAIAIGLFLIRRSHA